MYRSFPILRVLLRRGRRRYRSLPCIHEVCTGSLQLAQEELTEILFFQIADRYESGRARRAKGAPKSAVRMVSQIVSEQMPEISNQTQAGATTINEVETPQGLPGKDDLLASACTRRKHRTCCGTPRLYSGVSNNVLRSTCHAIRCSHLLRKL